jgi:hypothetical protein
MTHANVPHWDDVEAEEVDVGELRGRWRALGSAAGSFRAGVSLVEVMPGACSTPPHVQHHVAGPRGRDARRAPLAAG